MDSDSVTMETDDDDSSFEEEEEEEYNPKQEVWVQSGSDAKSYKPVHLNISYQMDAGDTATQQQKKTKGNDPTALAVLRRLSPELQQGYRILIDLMGDRCKSFAWPFMDKVDPVLLKLPDYYDRIKTPMWLSKIEEKFESMEYTSITEFVADVRQIFENCYRYNGLKHAVSRQAQMMECHFEQKLIQLSRHIRDKTHFRAKNSLQTTDQDSAMSSTFGRRVSQRILENRTTMTPVADAMEKQLEREEEERRKQRIIERKAELERLNKRLLEWEKEELLVEPLATQLKSMWEIPAIGQFLKLCCENMYLPEFSIFELERALILPQSSQLLARIFTNVLTVRYNRKRVSKKPPMPYEFWQDKLRKKLDIWYAFLTVESATRQSVARHLYIPERFFEVLGDVNPLIGRQFHDLAIYERVWLLKGMCDHLFETDYDVWVGVDTSVIEDQRAVVLGEDDEKASYLYFPHFLSTDLRIYRQAQIKEDKPKKKKVEKAEKSPTKKIKKEAEKTGTPSKANEGPKKRGRPRKNPDTDDSSSDKTGSTPAKTPTKTPAKSPAKIPAKTPASEGPKKRGRPRKDQATENESKTGVAATTPSQPTAGAKPGRGRPRKDGSTPSQAVKKTPAKPTAIVTPTRRSSRRSARLERAELEEQDEEKEEKSLNGEGVKEGVADEGGGNLEQKNQTCDRMLSPDAAESTAKCDGSPGRTDNKAEAVSQETEADAIGSDSKHLEMMSAGNSDAAVDGLSGKDEGRTSKSGIAQVGGFPCKVKGESLPEHAQCNGVMEVDEVDAKHQMHSSEGMSDSKEGEKVLSQVDQMKSEEEASNMDNVQTLSCNELQNSVDSASHNDVQHVENTSNGPSSLNQNQSNNVMDLDDKVAQLPGDEVEGKNQANNVIYIGEEDVGIESKDSNCMDVLSSGVKENSNLQVDYSVNVDKDSNKAGAQDEHQPEAQKINSKDEARRDVLVEKGESLLEMKAELVPKEEAMDMVQGNQIEGDPKPEESEVQSDVLVEKGESLLEMKAELVPKEEAMDMVQGDQIEGDPKPEESGEVMERVPTPPPPQPLPGILPPEGEFELVCDSVESFRMLVEKFAQKEETIVKGRKTIVQPIKRSGRTTELHKTLAKMQEDIEPIEAKLQKVVHKAREVVYKEYEAYKKNPSPNQEAADFWYQLHVKKPVQVIESSSVEASSVDDDFSSSESSSELDSDELSDQDSDGDETAEYDDSDGDYTPTERGAGVDLNGLEASTDNEGGKMDLYSGVEIAGRTMRSSKRRRAQKREDIRDRKKAKRSKIQIVKGVPLQGRYAKPDEDKETDETKLKKVHEELKENLKAGSTFQMTKHIIPGAAQKNFQPYKKADLQTSTRQSTARESSPAYHRDTSEKFIRILKRKAGSSEPDTVSPLTKPTKTSPHEPTLKVPFLQKSKTTVPAAADASSGDKKMKTETFSFTIDAKIWESLKDKPQERQRLIVEHVEKMKVAGGLKKEPPQKVQNSRLSPWFSRNTTSSGSSKSAISSGTTDGLVPQSESPEKRLPAGIDDASHSHMGESSPVFQQKQEDMPVLDPVGSQKVSLLQNTNMPALAPVLSQKIVQSNIIGHPGSISVQQALTQTQGIQQPRSGNLSTAIASSGNSQTQSIVSGGATLAVGASTLGGLGTAVPLQPGTQGSTIAIKPQATVVSLSPTRQGVQQVVTPPAQDVNRLASLSVQSVAAQPTAGATGSGVQSTIVLPTNLKVNMNNKQYKILYVQKPGASKPELCLQPCAADGTTPAGGTLQGAVPLVTMQQPLQPVPAATIGRNMQIQMVPQGGNKIVMQAVGGTPQNVAMQSPVRAPVAQNPSQAQAAQNVVLQNPLVAPQVVNPGAGSNTSVVTMISTPIPPVPSVHAHSTGAHEPLAGIQSQVPAGSAVSVKSVSLPQVAPSVQITPSVQMASMVQVPSAMSPVSVASQGTVLAGSPPKGVLNQVVHFVNSSMVAPSVAPTVVRSVAQPIVTPAGQSMTPSAAVPQSNVILQAASASGLILPAPEPSMKQITVQGMPQGGGK